MRRFTWVLFCFSFLQIFSKQIVFAKDKTHPCSKTVDCLRKVLGDQLQCDKNDSGYYNIDKLVMNIPVGNSSFVWENAEIDGLRDYTINELYINNKTKMFVFEVEFEHIIVSSPDSYYYFYFKGREPVVTQDYYNVTYNDLSLTLTIPYKGHYKVSEGHVFAYASNSNPIIDGGPDLKPTDKAALKNFKEILRDLPVTIREVILALAPVYINIFIQLNVCGNYDSNP